MFVSIDSVDRPSHALNNHWFVSDPDIVTILAKLVHTDEVSRVSILCLFYVYLV